MSVQPSLRARVPAGVRTGGQFATSDRDEAAITLTEAKSNAERAVEDAFAAGIAEGIRRARGEEPRSLDGSVLDLTDIDLSGVPETTVLDPGGSWAQPAPTRTGAAEAIPCLTCGGHGYGYPIDEAAGLYSGTCEGCQGVGSHDATPLGRDTVEVPRFGTFHRRRDDVHPDWPYAIRLEANRPLTDDEVQRAAQLLGYKYASTVRGEPLGDPVRDSTSSFVISADTTKSRSDDIGIALDDLEDGFDDFMREGSPVRTTNRAGQGTQGTRLVDGLKSAGLHFEIFYDSVFDTRKVAD